VPLAEGARTVRDALQQLFARHPRLRERVLTEQGELREHLNVFVGGRNVRFASGLATEVPDDARIFVLPSVSGG
jgi:molybdopterin synthase sulfur carrier subunit